MKLRRISVAGFKTFARRSDVVLEGGITAVVGPNGSGKSNLVDAIRWALGETNARELRGARMDEVIYSGGQGRGAMGVADVELVIDNEDGRLPFEEAEISVSRRVTRGGASEYRLNGEQVRLRDLERVLGQTGLTQSGYSVVAQNDIDGIIQATPLQRRVLIEQAAGVRSLRAASDDALGKVGRVEVKLLRLDDLLAEAEPRLAELEGEAEAASEQLELTARLQQLRGSLAREEWRAARGQVKQARTRLLGALARAGAASEAEAGFATRLDAQRAVLADAREAQRAAAERLEIARVGAERVTGDLRRWADRQVSGTLQRTLAGQEVAAALAERDASQGEGDRLAESLRAESEMSEGIEVRLTVARRAHVHATETLRGASEVLTRLDDAVTAAAEAHATADAAIRDHAARSGLLEEMLGGLAGEIESARRQAAGLSRAASDAAQAAEGQAAALAAAEARAADARARVAAARDVARDTQAAHAEAQREASRLGAHAAGLRGRLDAALGAGGGVARAVAEHRLPARRLVDCFAVGETDTAAAEAALEADLAAWVVDDLDAALAELSAEGVREQVLMAGMATPEGVAAPAGIRRAADIVTVDERARGALGHCLSNVWLADDLPAARAVVAEMGGRAVLPDGTVITPAGIRGGGGSGRTIALSATEHLAASEARAAGEAAAATAAAAAQAQDALAVAEVSAEDAVRASGRAFTAAAEAAAAASGAAAAARAEEARSVALEATMGTRSVERDRARSAFDEAHTARDAAAAALGAAREVAEAERVANRQRRFAVEESSRVLRVVELEGEQLRLVLEDLARRAENARTQAEAAGTRVLAAELRLLGAEGDLLIAVARSRASRAAALVAGAAVEEALARVEAAGFPTSAAEAAVSALDRERSEVAVAAARAADEQAAAEVELAAAEGRLAELAEAVRGDDEDEGPEPDAQAAEKAEREIVRLERRISAMGPVNALAPGQYESLRVRVLQLRADRDDLRGACEDIRWLAAGLAGEIERRFGQVFGAVCDHFHRLYEELFPGGRATLRLEPQAQSEPPAEAGEQGEDRARPAGVEILAQPAGKRLQPLTLLSGGERALTALAVILALQQVNPSPFYLFDEVDAPLDDSNVARFVRLLQRLSLTQQFMVVTHNHATMAAADTMYGVTIDNEGVSNMLSVRFTGDEKGGVIPVPAATTHPAARAV